MESSKSVSLKGKMIYDTMLIIISTARKQHKLLNDVKKNNMMYSKIFPRVITKWMCHCRNMMTDVIRFA